MISNILVVCVGNICRSPMAEALFRDALGDEDGFTVASAGLGALVDYEASEHSVTLMDEMGLDIRGHRARQLHPDMVRDADLVLVMEASHKRAIDEADVTARGKVHRLGEWQDRDIADPFRRSVDAYRVALDGIHEGVESWVEKIRSTGLE